MTGYQSKRAAGQDKLDSREREALKMALEALEGFIPYLPLKDEAQCNRYDLATTTIKAALAQPEQQPAAWMFQHDETGRMNYVSNDGIHNLTMFLKMNPRYALVCPLYTTPPQRQPLTDEQIEDIAAKTMFPINFARAIEAAHGIKENT